MQVRYRSCKALKHFLMTQSSQSTPLPIITASQEDPNTLRASTCRSVEYCFQQPLRGIGPTSKPNVSSSTAVTGPNFQSIHATHPSHLSHLRRRAEAVSSNCLWWSNTWKLIRSTSTLNPSSMLTLTLTLIMSPRLAFLFCSAGHHR